MIRRSILMLLIVVMSVGFVFAAGDEPKYGGVLRFGNPSGFSNMAPWVGIGATKYTYIGSVYDSLLSYGFPDGDIVPALAESWEIVDNLTYIFHLRENVTFHNGNSFTADDVKYSIEQIIAPDSRATLRGNLADIIESVDVVDALTVQINLMKPQSALLAILASAAAHIVDKEWAEEGHDFTSEMNGTGPFMFVSHELNVKTTYARNPNYWKPGLPYLDGIEVVAHKDDTARGNALKGGEVDFISYVPWPDMDFFESSPDFINLMGYNVFNMVRLNTSEPPFDNPLVRQAVNYAIDREEIIDLAWGGRGLPMTAGLIYPGTEYYDTSLETWEYNPAKAIELLKRAGYDDPSELSFTLIVNNQTIHLDTAEIMQSQWGRLGISVTMQVLENAVVSGMRSTGGYEAMQDGQAFFMLDASAYSTWFACSAASAQAIDFCDPELDNLLADAAATIDLEERKQLFHRYEQRLLFLAPWVFEYWRPQSEAMASYVKGYQRYEPGPIGLLSLNHFETVWLDK